MRLAASPCRGLFVSVDGPGGVGKSTMIRTLADALAREGIGCHLTTEPTRTVLGDLLRTGTDTYQGMALALLVAGDRHHHLTSEITPALTRAEVVISDRYVASSLVLQRMDGIDFDTIWQLNSGMLRPDLAVILNADPDVIAQRVAGRGATHSRFERQPDAARTESRLYTDTCTRLMARGWPVYPLDATDRSPDELAALVCSHLRTARAEAPGAITASQESA